MVSNEQYFTSNPNSEHNYQYFDFELLGNKLKFKTDSGVFSKSTIDFGSRVMLDATITRDFVDGKFLDLGTGYGPVGIALAKYYPSKEIDMVDVNERALALAKENTQANSVDNRTNVFQSNIYENITDKYAAIIVNPPIRAGKDVVTTMLVDAKKHLLDGGKIIAVLQKKQGAPSAKKNLEDTFGNVEVIKKSKGYYIFESVKNDNGK